MFTGEVLRRNLKGNQISAGDYEYRLIRATHAVIAYADSLIIKNITNNELLRERNRMHHSRSKFNPNPADRWESSATLRVVCPSNTVVITSNLLFEPASLIEERTTEAKLKKVPQPIGMHVVKFQCITEDLTEDVVEAERLLRVAFAPLEGPLDEFNLRVFEDAGIDYSGAVDEQSADAVFTMLEERFDNLLTAV